MSALLVSLAVGVATVALASVGGFPAVLPDVYKLVVGSGWMTGPEFVRTFAVAQVAPGPNMLSLALIGWRVAGAAGLATVTFSMLLPPAILAFAAGRLIDRLSEASWFPMVKAGIPPLVLGLILAAGLLTASIVVSAPVAYLLVAGAALMLALTRLNPLWAIVAGALFGVIFGRMGWL